MRGIYPSRLVGTLFLAVTLVGLLVGCSDSALASAGVEIKVLLDPGTFGNEYINWLEDAWLPVFEHENTNIRINPVLLTGNRLDVVATTVAGGVPFDIVVAAHTLPMIEGVGRGWYLPLDAYIAKWNDAKYMIPAVWAHTRWQGVTYAIPHHLPPRVIAYNKLLFAQEGLDPNRPPTSWAEMLVAARRLTLLSGDKIIRRGYHMTVTNQEMAMDMELFVANNAGQMLTEDYRKPRFHEAPGLEALNFMKQMYEINNPAGYATNLTSSVLQGFYTGQAAMIRAAGAQVAKTVAAEYGDMVELGIFLPRRSPQIQPATTCSINSMAILRFTQHPDEAWQVMAHLYRREALEQLALLRGQLIPRTDVNPFVLKYMPEAIPFYQVLEYIVPRPAWPSAAGYTYTTGLGELVRAAVLGQQAPEIALEEARRRTQLMLDAFWADADGLGTK